MGSSWHVKSDEESMLHFILAGVVKLNSVISDGAGNKGGIKQNFAE